MTALDRLSFQLYSARNFPPLTDQLAALEELGYAKVELYGALLEDVAALGDDLQRFHLTAPSCHIGLDQLRADLDGAVAAAHSLGTTLLVVPAIPHDQRAKDANGWRVLGGVLDEFQTALATSGLRLAWHNHDFEFQALPDRSMPLELIFETAPGLLWEADIGWVVRAGQDPVDWIRRYADRIVAFHVKDLAPAGEKTDEDGWADVGAGTVDWQRLWPAMQATPAELLVVEHDNPSDFKRFARNSRETMAAWPEATA